MISIRNDAKLRQRITFLNLSSTSVVWSGTISNTQSRNPRSHRVNLGSKLEPPGQSQTRVLFFRCRLRCWRGGAFQALPRANLVKPHGAFASLFISQSRTRFWTVEHSSLTLAQSRRGCQKFNLHVFFFFLCKTVQTSGDSFQHKLKGSEECCVR